MSYLVTRRWLNGCECGNTVTNIVDVPMLVGDVYDDGPFDAFEVIAVEEITDAQARAYDEAAS